MHLIHDAGRSGPSDNFTDLMFQPLGSEVANNPRLGLKGKTKLTAQASRFGFETATPTSAGTFNTKVEADFYAYNGIEQGQNRNRLRLRQAYGEYAGFLVPTRVSTGAPSMCGLWRTRSARSAHPSVVMAWASAATTKSPTKTC